RHRSGNAKRAAGGGQRADDRRLHVHAGGRRPASRAAPGPPRSEERPAPEQRVHHARRPAGRHLHHRLGHPPGKGCLVTARLASLSTRAQVALVATVLVLVAVFGYFAVISPKHSTAASLKKQTAAVQMQISRNRSTAFTKALPAVRSASVFRLAMAMPRQLQT